MRTTGVQIMITLTIPNDDHIALRAFGKALEEMALAHGAEPRKTTAGELSYKLNIDTTDATAALERLNTATGELMKAAPRMMQEARFDGEELQGKRKEPEIDTTAQQVEALVVPNATHIITEQKLVGDPEPVGDGNFSQGYIATVEEIADPVDSTGTPWDERIHSTSKALNADGTWRLRRKPKDMYEAEWAAFVEWVKAELQYQTEQQPVNLDHVSIDPAHDKGDETAELTVTFEDAVNASIEAVHTGIAQEFGAGIANAAFTGDRNEPPVTPPGDDFHTDEQTVAGIPPLPVPPPVVVAPPVPEVTAWDFPRLMTFLTERHGKIDVATVNTLLAQDGMSSVQELNAHPDKIGPFVARVKAHLGE
ncbi:hypothetical protein [Pectobacterium phage PEAT2]|uniref:Uncharacterized protein n=1 Tax=Pectobacterium phage PEAT2 TaxID=2053078 RepID=A0A2H4N7B6_9CAUD|nr:hypothetical protein F8206_gp11 [Pectobacterium phage PEAT2]ATV25078.1 hypothetical protein [Pectobacterium phage PEAT2]